MKYLLSLAMTLFVVALCSSNLQAQAEEVSITIEDASTVVESTMTVKVKGVGCSTDIKMIQDNVKKLDGVLDCTVVKKGATTSFQVIYNKDKVNVESIHAKVEDTPGCSDPKDRPYKVKV